MRRREFLSGAAGSLMAGVALSSSFWERTASAFDTAGPGDGPYGELQRPDANGLSLPPGFSSRRVATSGRRVAGTDVVWHSAPDGGGCFSSEAGGWVYVSNAELDDGHGGVSAIRFAPDGAIVDAYRILEGTNRNCSGGVTPWGTWLSCEENGPEGQVYECDPTRPSQGVVRPGLGAFNHEAAAVDASTGEVFLSEDHPEGRLYKFVPSRPGDLRSGELFAAAVRDDGRVTWSSTSPDEPDRRSSTTPFRGGEGIRFGDGVVYLATKLDRRVWGLDLETERIHVVYDCDSHRSGSLTHVDDLALHPATGRVFICEDGGNMELCVLAERTDGAPTVSPFLRFSCHHRSEVTGASFNPDGTRLYVSSQRGADGRTGETIEVVGPFAQRTAPARSVRQTSLARPSIEGPASAPRLSPARRVCNSS